ncbi:hypothetical protein ACFOOP_07310 [Marinicaulis aureus]|uniref:Uncharacterized protein n=1 Tax=Hyphococcus aureus TaxID=2666033 RepID=A0ABW1KV22_9PROT
MQLTAPTRTDLIKRLLTSLAAIIAVSAIFGLKAQEWEQHAAAEHRKAERIAATQLETGS